MKKNYLLITLLFISTMSFAQSVLLLEEFNDASQYSTSVAEYVTSTTQYFSLMDGSNIDAEITDVEDNFFAVQQLSASPVTMLFDDIDISGMTDLTFALAIAEDDATDGNEDWDEDDYVLFEYQIDNSGSWTNLLVVESTGATDTAPSLNGAGVTFITDTSEEFDILIGNPAGSLIDIRITFNGLTDADEDFIIDYIALVDNLDIFPGVDVNLPDGDAYPNGTTSVNVEYTITNTADQVDITVNDVFVANGTTSPGTYTYPVSTSDDTSYVVSVGVFLGATEVDGYEVSFEVSNTASIGENDIEGFSMYPNPVVDGRITINTMNNGAKAVQIFDMLGKQVLSANMEQNGVLKVNSLTTGMYILKVEEEGKVSTNRLLIE